MPEAKIPLAQAVTYIAAAPKSNAAYMGINAAMKDVENEATQPVPDHLRDSHYPGAKELGRGKGYKYAHDYEGGTVQQEYMKSPKKYYEPKEIGEEKEIKERLEEWRAD
jgi:putative ATPase